MFYTLQLIHQRPEWCRNIGRYAILGATMADITNENDFNVHLSSVGCKLSSVEGQHWNSAPSGLDQGYLRGYLLQIKGSAYNSNPVNVYLDTHTPGLWMKVVNQSWKEIFKATT